MVFTSSHVFFYSERDALSNFYPSPFHYRQIRFPTIEHFLMFQKAKCFGDEQRASRILTVTSPGEAKKLGREVSGYDETKWSEIRQQVVRAGARQKFAQNPQLMDVFLLTRGRILVEASPSDKLWGVGLASDDPLIRDPSNWQGSNLLGITLTNLREDWLEGFEQQTLEQAEHDLIAASLQRLHEQAYRELDP